MAMMRSCKFKQQLVSFVVCPGSDACRTGSMHCQASDSHVIGHCQCRYARLEVLEGIVAFHSHEQQAAEQHLRAAERQLARMQVSDASLAMLQASLTVSPGKGATAHIIPACSLIKTHTQLRSNACPYIHLLQSLGSASCIPVADLCSRSNSQCSLSLWMTSLITKLHVLCQLKRWPVCTITGDGLQQQGSNASTALLQRRCCGWGDLPD